MKNLTFRQIWSRYIKPTLFLIGGAFLAGFVLNVFYTPIKLTMGGVSGIASIIYQLTGRGNFLELGTLVAILNIPLLILGLVKIGLKFVWRSIVGTFVYSAAVNLTTPWMKDWFEKYVNVAAHGGAKPDMLIFCLFGGIIYGISMGLILKGGYTTGGTDILGVVIHRAFPNISIGNILMGLDFCVISSTLIFYRDPSNTQIILALYSFVALYLTSKFTDLTIEGFETTRMCYVISADPEAVANEIFKQLDRGATLIKGIGMYSKLEKPIVFSVMSPRQVPKLKKIAKSIDPKAFVVITEAREVHGEGFTAENEHDFLNVV